MRVVQRVREKRCVNLGAPVKVALVTSVSAGTPWAEITMPGRLEYCIRHGYTNVIYCESYADAVGGYGRLLPLLDAHDLVWTLDADCLITDHTKRIEDVPDLGPHVSICEEGIGPHALVNGGSIVWRATHGTRSLLHEILEAGPEWETLTYSLQQWLMIHHARLADRLKVCDKHAFNGAAHANVCVWREGDLVYHPCGDAPELRCDKLRQRLASVVR